MRSRTVKCFRDFGTHRIAATLIAMLVAGCADRDKVTMSYIGVNHTETYIATLYINGQGGVMNVFPMGGGGVVCCVTLPRRWKPGLTVKITWREEGDWLRDEKGQPVIREGKKVLIEGPWKERTVEVQPYTEKDLGAGLHVHFLPGDQVLVKVSNISPHHKDYNPPYPRRPGQPSR
ncbi:DUF3304 domain-containing protein [Caldimonas sp.]|uniref:DUF3304 domain-containing protein n=1 Tax=Caldimonas sp. TaxID=2838790 RepID=UPI00391CACE2